MSKKRITINLDSELIAKIHDLQAKEIRDSNASVSFSKTIGNVLMRNLE